MSEQVVIDRRFRGPPESGHGGYVCGLVAEIIGLTSEVTLRRPPPLDVPLDVARADGGGVALREGEIVIAEGVLASVEVDVPGPVDISEAMAASESYLGFRHHTFPTCFGCGPQRAEGEGLRIFPGRVDGRDIVAAPWTPDGSLADEDGVVRAEFMWAALDCPGAWSVLSTEKGIQPVVLGRLAAKLLSPIKCETGCVAVGWKEAEDGRKYHTGTAIYSADGELHAVGRATWVRLA
jgi:hypothetical protein